ncbi:hypothetical protein K4K54_003828 [Colletotrichum sp. SAR 10_86]|nr:hypothetical protein K4K53_006320 [Colletotrichum sp. SAR 10_77]KAI8226451.1 hypothetical protein K4K54_003828 [Colletotrichum sp. SAR 10_86]KAJ5002016.1 hypothetical protein K4K48_000694 [Colletotrichum sp. SAR 10_66]
MTVRTLPERHKVDKPFRTPQLSATQATLTFCTPLVAAPGQVSPTSLALLPSARPADPVTDIRNLLPELKGILNSATNANDDTILEIWLQLLANAAESVVVIAHLSDDKSPHDRAQTKTETPRGNSQQPSAS